MPSPNESSSLLNDPAAASASEPRPALGLGKLLALIVALLVVQAVITYPWCLRFNNFAYGDPGATLAVESLEDQGLRPAVDFGQPYGLLTLLVGRVWFSAFGKTPVAYMGLMAACNLMVGWGLARLLCAQRLGVADVALVAVSLTQLAPSCYPGPVYGLETSLLCHALAEQARGRRGSALALATVCCFVKPTMAYIYGLLLLIAIVAAALRRESPRARLAAIGRPIACAAVVGAGVVALLSLVYGVDSLVNAVLWPFLAGSKHYQIERFGFFRGEGRYFWWPPGVRPGYYLGTIAGTWAIATLVLFAGVAAEAWTRARGKSSPLPGNNAEIQACCALMHLAFVTLFFAHVWSWWYYYYILISGVIAGSRRGRAFRLASWLLAATAILPTFDRGRECQRIWKTAAPHSENAWLWFTPREHEAWMRVLEITRGHRPVMLNYVGCADVISPGFTPPTALWFYRGIALPVEIERKKAQVASASMVIMTPPTSSYPPFSEYWPEVAAVLKDWKCVFDDEGFRVYARSEPAPARPRAEPGQGSSPAAVTRPRESS